ncbi:MAG: AI-2E family transporter [Planctomycetota bacterium]
MAGYLRKRSVRIALLVGLVLATFGFVYWLREIFAPVIAGFLIAYVLDPLADRLEARKMRRFNAVLVIFAVATVLLLAFTFTAGFYTVRGARVAFYSAVGEPSAAPGQQGAAKASITDKSDWRSQHTHFLDRNDNGIWDLGYLEKAKRSVVESLEKGEDEALGKQIAARIRQIEDELREEFTDDDQHFDLSKAVDSRLVRTFQESDSLLNALLTYLQGAPEGDESKPAPKAVDEAELASDTAARTAALVVKELQGQQEEVVEAQEGGGFFVVLSWFVLCPLYVFFFLLEIDTMIATIRRYLPATQRDRVVRIFSQIDRILSSFFRGRLTVCLIKGGVTSLLLLILGVPFWFPIGMIAGFLSLIPYVGIWLAIVPALLLGWLEHESLMRLLLVGGAFAAMEGVEGFVLIPTFLGKEVGLHPLTIVVTLLIFGKLFGFIGVLLSVPLAAIAKILGNEFLMPLIRGFADEDPRAPPPEPS